MRNWGIPQKQSAKFGSEKDFPAQLRVFLPLNSLSWRERLRLMILKGLADAALMLARLWLRLMGGK